MGYQKNLEALRVSSTLVIVYFHMVRVYLAEIFPDLFAVPAKQIERAYLFVEFFFVLSGYFLYFSLKKHVSFLEFVKRKFIRLWPVFTFSIVCSVVCLRSYDKYEVHVLDILLLQGSGLLLEQGLNFNAWYVSSLFLGMVAYGYFLKGYSGKNATCYIVLVVYFSLYHIIRNTFDVYTNCLLRAFSGLGTGYLLAKTLSSYSVKHFELAKEKVSTIYYILYSLAESVILFSVISTLICHKGGCSYMVAVIQFSILLWLFSVRRGAVSNVFEKLMCCPVGKYCYSIYIMQNLSFYISLRILWSHKNFCYSHSVLAVVLAFVISVLLGIITYYLVEVPSYKFLSSKLINEDISKKG